MKPYQTLLKEAKVLTTQARKTLETKEGKKPGAQYFVFPEKAPGSGSYPISDITHAKNALTRVSVNGTLAEQAAVRKAVYNRYPELKESYKERHGVSPLSEKVSGIKEVNTMDVKSFEEVLMNYSEKIASLEPEGMEYVKAAMIDELDKISIEKTAIASPGLQGLIGLPEMLGAGAGGLAGGIFGATRKVAPQTLLGRLGITQESTAGRRILNAILGMLGGGAIGGLGTAGVHGAQSGALRTLLESLQAGKGMKGTTSLGGLAPGLEGIPGM
ncbi:MAG: hypothetical protein KKD44_28395 [Proteobacteria bacterium]|nr:hypothetical protein [Pseudomonadota bacterium]